MDEPRYTRAEIVRMMADRQSDVARILGVSRQLINQWSRSEAPVPPQYVVPICRHLAGKVQPYELRPDFYPKDFRFKPKKPKNEIIQVQGRPPLRAQPSARQRRAVAREARRASGASQQD